ncbi:AglZ/HisF2 family acetamidino modification protein [Mesorhizobium sp. SP-1A]|uniref:AglZ/HisF2 family acetamidino modification protein n=1 Tax=Mesorhizobium sp. SP-1A TaxID=3077840 RepID=UPI0028F74794|nr:AglZ/HisF2 family acetamidino modification protein [Mesorhizobium sp. SP-1A]
MLKNRVIPCLLLQAGRLVKTTKFDTPRYVGDPINAIRIFNRKEVDELIVLDITASREGREPNYGLIEELAGECFMPLCYGGGVKTPEQAQRLFKLGVEKLSIQPINASEVETIAKISDQFGAQAVVASVDVRRNWRGVPKLFSSATRKTLDIPWLSHLERLVKAGAGEILLNAVHKDGTMSGLDLELVSSASKAVDVPLTVIGGVGSMADIKSGVEAGASAVAAGAFFVFHGKHKAVLITYPSYGELEKLLERN